jgi:hypothetical protein
MPSYSRASCNTGNWNERSLGCHEGQGSTDPTYHHWHKEFSGLQVDRARRLKELKEEKAMLRSLVVRAIQLLPVTGEGKTHPSVLSPRHACNDSRRAAGTGTVAFDASVFVSFISP